MNNAPKEKEVEKAIMQGLRYLKIYCQKVHSGAILKAMPNKFGKPKVYKVKLADEGTPDIIACVPVEITPEMAGQTIGGFVGIEVKRDYSEIKKWLKQKEERARVQKSQHNIIREAGGVVTLAASIDEVIEDLKFLRFLK